MSIKNAADAREIISFWNSSPPVDPIERQARWVLVNQAIGYLAGLQGPEATKLSEALKEADSRLVQHHEATYKLEWGSVCHVCVKPGEPFPEGVFLKIRDALDVIKKAVKQ